MANRTHPSPPRFIRKAATVFVMGTELDGTDWAIIGEIQGDARLSFNQIAKRVNLSAPSVAARIRRLEQAGVIEGYHARINSAAVGLPVTAFLQLHCHPGRCLLKTSAAEKFPEIVEIHRLSGDSCTMVKVRAASMAHLSSFLERIGEHADANSHIVLESPLEHRTLQVPPPAPTPTRHRGWST
jgi:Lrp/AsnC family transcriptional regulator, leucine-responsive regulatory protein